MTRSLSRNSFLYMTLSRAFGIVLGALLLFGLGIHLLLIRPTMERVANAQMQQASSEMETSILQLARGTETILYTIRGVLEHNTLSKSAPDKPDQLWLEQPHQIAALNSFFLPFIDNNSISSIHLARQDGSELLILRDENGQPLNRISHPGAKGSDVFYLRWDQELSVHTRTQGDADYDTKSRPWFQGATKNTVSHHTHWTQPYIFLATGDPGITVSQRWPELHHCSRHPPQRHLAIHQSAPYQPTWFCPIAQRADADALTPPEITDNDQAAWPAGTQAI